MSGARESTSQDPFGLCGTTIEGKYRIASVVGDGGFGVVYRGVHKGFGELIAVKCLEIPTTLDDEARDALLEQLRDEGRILHRLSRQSSAIVQALDVGAFTTPAGMWVPYLVLEWLDGQTLADFLAERQERGEPPYALADAIALLEPAARALALAHAQKVAHRDVKPPNLFVTEVGGQRTLKVLDFGLAKMLADVPSISQQLVATKLGPSAFTPRYGAPEQFNKKRGATGPWTDVFALALVMVELLTGRKALEGDDATELYIAAADLTERPTARARGAVVSDQVEAVIAKALSVEARERYPEAGSFWDALVAAAGGAPGPSATRDDARTIADRAPPADSSGSKRSTSNPSGDPLLTATLPVESLDEPPPKTPIIVKAGPGLPVEGRRADDPMAETPLHARLPQAPASVRADELTIPLTPVLKKTPARRSRSWVGIVAFVALGAGGVALFTLRNVDSPGHVAPHPSGNVSVHAKAPAPSARATQARTAPSAAPTAIASATASATAPPAPPPDDMIAFPPATASLGAGADTREVTLSHGFFLDKFEVTTHAYEACVSAHMCSAADRVSVTAEFAGLVADADAGVDGPTQLAKARAAFSKNWTERCNLPRGAHNHPINCVDFASAEAYCHWKGRRLPTEAEWEFAARGSSRRVFPWGSDPPVCDHTCFDKNGACIYAGGGEVATCPSGLHAADRTAEGVYDLGGNVAEWVVDGFVSPAPGGVDPIGPTNAPKRVVRGGSFYDVAEALKATARRAVAPSIAHVTIGFRCALDAAPILDDAGP